MKLKNIKSDIESFLFEWKSDSNCPCSWEVPDHSDSGDGSDYGCYIFLDLNHCGQHVKCFMPKFYKKCLAKKEQDKIQELINNSY